MAVGCKYLSKDHLHGFSSYKYSSVETNPLTKYILIPWWNAVVKLCPLWLAPNLITFVGFLLLLLIFCILWYLDPDYMTSSNDIGFYRPPIPRWVWLYAAASQFTAHTLDGIDGKQARRTGTSSPLGELFDHGLDSFGCILLPLSMYSAIGRGTEWSVSPIDCYWVTSIIMIGFYVAHWEKYITGTLYMPWAYDLGEVGGTLFYLISGIFGVQIWKFDFITGWSCAYTFKTAIFTAFAVTVVVSVYNVIQFSRTSINTEHNTDTSTGSTPPNPALASRSMVLPGVSLLILFSFSSVWAAFSPTDILSRETRLFIVVVGIIFSNITCKLIIAQMSSQSVEPFNYLLLPLVLAVGSSFVQPHLELLSLYSLAAVSMVTHLHFGISIVIELSNYFNIRIFSISKPSAPSSPIK